MKYLLLILFVLNIAYADQAAYISKQDAEYAANVIRNYPMVMFYCEPCGDTHWQMESINSVYARYTEFENYWEVVINDKGVDLAYTYVLDKNIWVNIAKEILYYDWVSDVTPILAANVYRENFSLDYIYYYHPETEPAGLYILSFDYYSTDVEYAYFEYRLYCPTKTAREITGDNWDKARSVITEDKIKFAGYPVMRTVTRDICH